LCLVVGYGADERPSVMEIGAHLIKNENLSVLLLEMDLRISNLRDSCSYFRRRLIWDSTAHVRGDGHVNFLGVSQVQTSHGRHKTF